jgi:hypothetical protein
VQQLHCSQTQPFETIISDYMACMQRNRELEVGFAVQAVERRQHAVAVTSPGSR